MCFCECKWKMFRQMEQHKGSTSPCCSCRAKSVQHSWNDRKDDEPLNHFSSHKGKTSKPSFRWLAAFIPSWMQSGRGKPVQEGRVWENCCTHPANWPNHQLAMLSAWCWLHWPKIRVWRATVKFWCNYIICDTSFFFVSMPGSDASCFASWRSGSKSSWSFSKSICAVNQWGKRDCVCFISCQTYISEIKLELILFIRIILDIYSNAKIFFTEVTIFLWAYYSIIIYSSSIFFLLDSWRAPLHDSQLKIILVQHFSSCSVWNKPFQLSSNN